MCTRKIPIQANINLLLSHNSHQFPFSKNKSRCLLNSSVLSSVAFLVIHSICVLSLSWHSLSSMESRKRLPFRLTSGCLFHRAETLSMLLLGFPFTHPELIELLLKCSSWSPEKTHNQEKFSEFLSINKLPIIQAIIFVKSLKSNMKCTAFIFL